MKEDILCLCVPMLLWETCRKGKDDPCMFAGIPRSWIYIAISLQSHQNAGFAGIPGRKERRCPKETQNNIEKCLVFGILSGTRPKNIYSICFSKSRYWSSGDLKSEGNKSPTRKCSTFGSGFWGRISKGRNIWKDLGDYRLKAVRIVH